MRIQESSVLIAPRRLFLIRNIQMGKNVAAGQI
jgi:hypothetical protein